MIYDLVAVGGVIFWLAFGLFTVLMLAYVSEDKFRTSSFILVIALVFFLGFTNLPILQAVREQPSLILYYVLGYLGIAAVWAMIKWRMFFLPKLFERYEEFRSGWLAKKGLNEVPADGRLRGEMLDQARSYGADPTYHRMVSNNKARIMGWMAYWPFSLLGTFVGDFMHRVLTTMYKMVAGLFQRMSDGMASRYDELN